MKKRILGLISVVGVLGVTVVLLFSLGTDIGKVFPNIKPVPASILELENSGFFKYFYPNAEDGSHTKLEFPKVESGDPSPPNQPPAPPPPESPTPTSLPPSPQPPKSPTPTSEPESSLSPDCDPFDGMELSLVTLSIREDIMVFPLYLKTEGDVIPGLDPPDDTPPSEYHALLLGFVKSNSCGLQGFDDRLYCMFTVTPDMPGSVAVFQLFLDECEDPVFTQLYVTIPELASPKCTSDLDETACEAADGTWKRPVTGGDYYCDCP